MGGERAYGYLRGLRDGVPIGLGYLAVAFSLGITAKNAGLSPFAATLSSLLTNASAGQYAGFTLIARAAGMAEVILMTAIINARYLLMSCALSQKLRPDEPLFKRLLLGHCVTDEIFGISMAVPGALNPLYAFGALCVASPGWALGTYLGVVMGGVLPQNVVYALSVGLYGMFVAIVVPPATHSRVLAAVVALSMALSFVLDRWGIMGEGARVIVLTLVIAGGAALLFPVREEAAHAA